MIRWMMARGFSRCTLAAAWIALVAVPLAPVVAEDATAVEGRLSATAKYLSSDELEGRGVGTKGLDLAADYIAEQFRTLGLKTELVDGGPFQTFEMTTGSELGSPNTLTFVGPGGEDGEPRKIELALDEQFTPLAIGGSGTFDLPLVFVGYGITGKDENYDDYEGIDVKDKAVVILRHEPQQANPHSVFNGTDHSEHAPFRRKVSNAFEHGAAAVIFCNDQFEVDKQLASLRKRWQVAVDEIAEASERFKKIEKPSADEWRAYENKIAHLCEDVGKYAEQLDEARDPLLPFRGAGPSASEGRSFPVLSCQRGVLDQIVKQAMGMSLAELEVEMDKGPTPRSAPLEGWRAVGETHVERHEVGVKNVVGVWEGEGPLADETIVIGAHYDHLGYGGSGSAAPGVHEIHNGADDNGSGTTVLIEVARDIVARGKLPRRIVFIAFTGEERGLVGSARYVREPLFPIDKTVAMLNLDMVGRLTDEKLIVHGTGTATEFDALVDRFGKDYGFDITKKPGGFGPSDHSSFYSAKVPVLFFFTGSHKDYHRPSDDFDKLNIPGMRRIAEMVAEIGVTLAKADTRPAYKEVQDMGEIARSGGDRPYFGSIPDFAGDEPGYALSGVAKGGPAARGGLQGGDTIVKFGDSKIGNLEDFDSALRKYKAGDKVPVTVKRDGDEVTLEVTLDPPR
ncbi:MAG: PDZ domain-containing protein [Planctomycetota bacterium]|nr:MAG: PDZ domain-containing protein [Planctomycetota bacterium]